MDIPADAIEQALLVERARLHRAASATAIGATVLAAATTLWTMLPYAGPAAITRWLVVLGAAIGLRLAIVVMHGRDPDAEVRAARWLVRHRLAFAAHGLAWAALGLQVMPDAAHDGFDILVFTLTAMTAASLISTAFDIGAAMAFAVPTLTPIVLQMVAAPDRTSSGLSAAIALFIAFALMSAVRAHLVTLDSVRLRLREAANADEARRQAGAAESAREELAQRNHQMDQLLRNTRQGYWFIDNRGMTTDVNPAMCALLGRPREDIVGRSVFEFFSGEDLLTLHDEIERRHLREAGGYEIGLRRPDGTRLLCFNHATPMLDIHGEQIGSVGLWTDLTPIRQTEATLRMYEVVTNSITDAVSVIDDAGIYHLVNDAWCRMRTSRASV